MTNAITRLPGVPVRGAFLREVNRLTTLSGRRVEDVAATVGLPLAALTGAHGGLITVPGSKLRAIAEAIGADHLALTRVWLGGHSAWLLPLFDEVLGEQRQAST
ncbi:hypothetical protein [Falsiroseomonas oryzae]|uniref:hypothetical protein n=1 Tax=Falsiroseomonas oryzae TaxID=2766473 RepID=UPI0022EB03AE|nr:hypothetical protein [Roseomonas sp. MO-31]